MIIFALVVILFYTTSKSEHSNKKEEFAHAQSTGKPTIVKFHAEWCGHCKAMKEDWNKFAEKNDKSPLIIVEIDGGDKSGSELSKIHGIRGFPTVLFLPHGLGVHEDHVVYNGDRSYQSLCQFHDKFVKNL